jgi:23S rRNA (uracil1939-C5)-methyltransferase
MDWGFMDYTECINDTASTEDRTSLKTNEMVEIDIHDTTFDGVGVGRYRGQVVFVIGALNGERILTQIIKTKKDYAIGKIVKKLVNSPKRINIDCKTFGKCGGCTFRHIHYEYELELKQNIVIHNFQYPTEIAAPIGKILGSDEIFCYRNKVQYPVAQVNGVMKFGFFEKRSHKLITHKDCKLQEKNFYEIAENIVNFCNINQITAYNEETRKGLLRHILLRKGYYSNEISICLVVAEETDAFEKLEYPVAFCVNNAPTNTILTNFIINNLYISDTICGNKVCIGVDNFFQINTPQAELLYSIAKDFAELTENDTVLDLCCGIGTITMYLSKYCKSITGVEISKTSIKLAKKAAFENNLQNINYICTDIDKLKVKNSYDDVIMDPPRRGINKVTVDYLLEMSPKTMVYISCNPTTAARDCRKFEKNGYKVAKIQPVDMFPRTQHIELVIQLKLNVET